jgi:Domain of unknown function (DUF4398)
MRIVSLLFVLFIASCGLATTRPKIEMSLAQSAFMAAKEAGADVHASNLFKQAEDFYLKAKSSYRRKYFNKAKEYALQSIKYSEEAEYTAIRKKALEGNAE